VAGDQEKHCLKKPLAFLETLEQMRLYQIDNKYKAFLAWRKINISSFVPIPAQEPLPNDPQ